MADPHGEDDGDGGPRDAGGEGCRNAIGDRVDMEGSLIGAPVGPESVQQPDSIDGGSGFQQEALMSSIEEETVGSLNEAVGAINGSRSDSEDSKGKVSNLVEFFDHNKERMQHGPAKTMKVDVELDRMEAQPLQISPAIDITLATEQQHNGKKNSLNAEPTSSHTDESQVPLVPEAETLRLAAENIVQILQSPVIPSHHTLRNLPIHIPTEKTNPSPQLLPCFDLPHTVNPHSLRQFKPNVK